MYRETKVRVTAEFTSQPMQTKRGIEEKREKEAARPVHGSSPHPVTDISGPGPRFIRRF